MSVSTIKVLNIILGKPLSITTRRCNKNDHFDNNKIDNNDNFSGLKDDDNEEIKHITP